MLAAATIEDLALTITQEIRIRAPLSLPGHRTVTIAEDV